jgi:DNA mismatch repair protein MSH4
MCSHSYSDNTSRPWTGQSRATSLTRPHTQSRPATAPTTAANPRHDASFVIALLEGRGIAREVGLAALDRDTGRAILIQVQLLVAVYHVVHVA